MKTSRVPRVSTSGASSAAERLRRTANSKGESRCSKCARQSPLPSLALPPGGHARRGGIAASWCEEVHPPAACLFVLADMRVTCPHARAEGVGDTQAGCSRLGAPRNSSTAPPANNTAGQGCVLTCTATDRPHSGKGHASKAPSCHMCMQHACSMHAAEYAPQCPRMHVWLIVSQPRCAGARPGSAPATVSGANSHCGTSQRGASAAVIRMRTTPAAGMVTARASRSMSGPSSGAVVSTAVSVAEKRAPVRAQRAA